MRGLSAVGAQCRGGGNAHRRGRTPLPNEPEIRDVMTTGNSPFYKFSNAVGDISIPECMTLSSRTGDIITRYTVQ